MVVADRAAGGEGIAQPMAVLRRHAVGDIGERRGALVSGDDEIGVVPVTAYDSIRRHYLAIDDPRAVGSSPDEHLEGSQRHHADDRAAAAEHHSDR